MQSEAFVRADDTAAIETAKQLIAYGRDVRDRKVTKLIGIASPSMEQARAAREELGLFFSEGESLAAHDTQTDHNTPS